MANDGHSIDVDPDELALFQSLYMRGGCMAFAIALSRRTGWPIVSYEDADGRLIHCGCELPSGQLFDVRGEVDRQTFVLDFHHDGGRIVSSGEPAIQRAHFQREDQIARADRHIHMLFPDLPGRSAELDKAQAFIDDLDELCRRHGMAIHGTIPNSIVLGEAHGDEVYELSPAVTGGGYFIARRLKPRSEAA